MFFLRPLCYLHSLLALFSALASQNDKSSCESLAVGGQAVMEGIMMRNGNFLSIAIRQANGTIVAIKRPWKALFSSAISKKPWLRGFPILVETMVNGIKTLNTSVEYAAPEDEAEKIQPWQLVLTLVIALAFAILFFIVIPHFLTIGLKYLSIAGDMNSISFHVWDGLLKFAMFVGYIALIGRVEDIRRVFEYHGAEHKSIAAYEGRENPITPAAAAAYSRLHPRCGTTFMLFVIVISIILHSFFIPAFLWVWTPDNVIAKHIIVLILKIALVVPISAAAYELIRKAAQMKSLIGRWVLQSPGLLLQSLTTKEPDYLQLEVGLVALKEALGEHAGVTIETPAYETIVETN